MHFTAAATSYEVALLHSDESVNKVIKVVHNFIEGDTLIIDIAKRKVLNNGKAIMNGLQIQSEFLIFLLKTSQTKIQSQKQYQI